MNCTASCANGPMASGAGANSRQCSREMGPPGVFAAEGEEWKRQRRPRHHGAEHQSPAPLLPSNTHHDRATVAARLTDAAQAGVALDISQELTSYTLDTISWLAFGHDLNTLGRGEGELQGHIQRLFYMLARGLPLPCPTGDGSNFPPIVRWIAPSRRSTRQSSGSSRRRETA